MISYPENALHEHAVADPGGGGAEGAMPPLSPVQIQVRIQGGAPGARAPPLTLGFEAPKLSIFGPYLIFP